VSWLPNASILDRDIWYVVIRRRAKQVVDVWQYVGYPGLDRHKSPAYELDLHYLQGKLLLSLDLDNCNLGHTSDS
jgi:hypothetical protein